MTKTKTSLEDFIKSYLENTKKNDTGPSYSEWLRKNGTSAENIYQRGIQGTEAEYKSSLPSYGALAENLAGGGLSGGGYEKYLRDMSEKNYKAEKNSALNNMLKTMEKNLEDYKSETEEKDTSKPMSYTTALYYLDREKFPNYDDAYSFALDIGLDEETADRAAKYVSDKYRKKIKEEILKSIVNKSLTESQTRKYAEGLNLPEEDIEELCAYAKEINEYISTSNRYEYMNKNK